MSRESRRWLELSVRCPSAGERAPLLADGLLALGGRAVQERAGWYVTYLADRGTLTGFEEEVEAVLGEATGLAGFEVRLAWQAQEDWAESWKQGLTARRITDRLVVRPSWIEYEPEGHQIVIVLDPGMAFGTAEHGTTRGCLRLLDELVQPGDYVLDVGSGSGVLAVAAARLGAGSVVAVEGDALACEALRDNVIANGVAAAVRVVERWADAELLRGHRGVSGLVANIETGILAPLFPALVDTVRPGGWLVLSGITVDESSGVRDAIVGLGGMPEHEDVDDAWVSAAFRLPDRPA